MGNETCFGDAEASTLLAKKFRTMLISDKKVSENKTDRNFNSTVQDFQVLSWATPSHAFKANQYT